MKTSSCKAKGRNLQNYIVQRILDHFPELTPDDCSGRSMGANGEDILLSKAARLLLPISIEAKSKAAYAVYKDYLQAVANAKDYNPVLVIKQNRGSPLAVVDLDFLLRMLTFYGRETQKLCSKKS